MLQPISSFLRERKEKINRQETDFSDLKPITIHFDGSIDPRNIASGREYSMDLFSAHGGDVVASKIDLKNGAVGIVPDDWENVAVTNHFAVFEPDLTRVIPEFLHLIVQMPMFKDLLWRNKVGAEGRKEVKITFFVAQEVPLPPLDVQRAIVDKWHAAQNQFRSGVEAIETQRRAADKGFLADLGLDLPEDVPRRRVMALGFDAMNRWDLASAQLVGRDRLISHWDEKPLSEIVWPLSQSNARLVPASKPEDQWNYIGMENVEAQSGRLVDFAPRLGAEVISASVVFDADSVLYGKLRPYLRKVIVPADYDLKEGVASSEFLNFKPREDVDIRFLATFLRSALVADYASQSTGGRMPRVAPETLLGIPVPLPPIEIQREIVARLHTSQSELEARRQKLQSDLEAARTEVENRILGRL